MCSKRVLLRLTQPRHATRPIATLQNDKMSAALAALGLEAQGRAVQVAERGVEVRRRWPPFQMAGARRLRATRVDNCGTPPKEISANSIAANLKPWLVQICGM